MPRSALPPTGGRHPASTGSRTAARRRAGAATVILATAVATGGVATASTYAYAAAGCRVAYAVTPSTAGR